MSATRRTATTVFTPLLMGLWFGLVSGLLEGLVRVARKGLAEAPLQIGAYVAWMPALTNGLLLAILGSVFGLAALIMPRLGSPRVWLATFGFLGVLDILWLWAPPLALYAIVLIAAGIALQLSRTLAGHLGGFRRLVGWSAPALLMLVIATAGGIEGWRTWREYRIREHLTSAAPGRPNVLLLVLDTVRAMNLSAYGYFRETSPAMTALAARGALFEQSISVSSWTLPSHAAMFTGRWLHEQGTGWKDPLDDRWPTLAEQLGELGYISGGFISNLNYCDREFGLARGFAHYEDHPLNWRRALRSSKLGDLVSRQRWLDRRFGPGGLWTRKHADQLSGDFLAWEARQPADRPWFGFINFFDAHRDYWSPREYRRLFTDDSARAPSVPFKKPPANAGRLGRHDPIELYDRAIRYTDDEIGKLLAELARRGELDNTLVIITSDHGEEFEEHGYVGHGNSLYLPSIAVPLIMAFPARIPAGVRVPQTVSIRDIPATVMDLVGAGSSAPFPGGSLARYWGAAPPGRPDTVVAELGYAWGKPSWLPVSQGDMASVLVGSRHLIRGGRGDLELFDFVTDRWEQDNFYPDSAAHPMTRAMQSALEALPVQTQAHRPPPNDNAAAELGND